MHATNAHVEANRQMTICNACRYCEGLCAVFPAMERSRTFSEAVSNISPTCVTVAVRAITPVSMRRRTNSPLMYRRLSPS